jgi:hypothetical protein
MALKEAGTTATNLTKKIGKVINPKKNGNKK